MHENVQGSFIYTSTKLKTTQTSVKGRRRDETRSVSTTEHPSGVKARQLLLLAIARLHLKTTGRVKGAGHERARATRFHLCEVQEHNRLVYVSEASLALLSHEGPLQGDGNALGLLFNPSMKLDASPIKRWTVIPFPSRVQQNADHER